MWFHLTYENDISYSGCETCHMKVSFHYRATGAIQKQLDTIPNREEPQVRSFNSCALWLNCSRNMAQRRCLLTVQLWVQSVGMHILQRLLSASVTVAWTKQMDIGKNCAATSLSRLF